MIDEQNVFNQPVKSNSITYDIIPKIANDQGDDYTPSCLLDYNYFNKYFKIIAISLKIHWRLSTILKTSKKSVWNKVFWYVKVCIL